MKKLLAILAVAMMISSSFIILCNPEEEQSLPDGFDNINLSSNLDYLYQPVSEGTNILDFTNQTDPSEAIIINNAEGLKRLSEIVNNDDISIRNDFSGYSIYLTNDVTLEGEWDPIGQRLDYVHSGDADVRPFNGTFDGQGYSIYNMQITKTPIKVNTHFGLFGMVSDDAVIKNIQLINSSISVGSEDSYVFAGGIVGYNRGTIENCYNLGHINVSASIFAFVGGIAGENDGGTIQNCYSFGMMDVVASENLRAGGIIGWGTTGTIENCNSTFNLKVVSKTDTVCAGGIVGNSQMDIQNCHNSGRIDATSEDDQSEVGGIAGYNAGTIQNCSNTGNISVMSLSVMSTNFGLIVGGIVGHSRMDIQNCHNSGSIDATSTRTQSIAGGIAGICSETIRDCQNIGNITANTSTDRNLDEGSHNHVLAYAGGIAGASYKAIQNCFNTGRITAEIQAKIYSIILVGGIVAWNGEGIIENSYNTGNLNSVMPDAVSGFANVGGIVADNDGTCENCYYLENTVVEGNNFGETFNSAGILATGGTLLNALNTWVESRESEEYSFWMNETLPVFIDWLEVAKGSATTLSKNSDGIYEINNAYQLALIANDLKGHYILTDNIDLSGYPWRPIGNSDSKFTGTFDGNGYEISNIFIIGETQYAGLFGHVGSKGVIKNTGLFNTMINTASVSKSYAAGFAAYNEGKIQNCYGTGYIDNSSDSDSYVGGIAAYNKGAIQNCYYFGIISTHTANPPFHVGGISGENKGTIENCYEIGGNTIAPIGVDGSEGVVGSEITLLNALNDWVKENGTSEFKLWKGDMRPVFCETWGEAAIAYGVEFSGNEINSEFELGAFANYVNSGNIDVDATLVKNLDLSFYGWAPIGNSNSKFMGTFDGNGYELFNLKITGEVQHAGFFSHIGTEGVVKNLHLIDSLVFTNSNTAVMAAGGIAAYNEGTIDNCYINGDVMVISMRPAIVGGIVGLNEGMIYACYLDGNVTGLSNNIEDNNIPNMYLGGIAGFNRDTILSCINAGDVSVISARYAHVGGIAGQNGELIDNCYNLGDVIAISTYRAYAGGITGENRNASIENCYNTGAVAASSSTSNAYAAGIAGHNYGEHTLIRNCYNVGNVTAESESAYAYAGGITGENRNASIENCYNGGDITAFTSYHAYSAGIVSINYGTVQNCYNAGDVNIFNNGAFSFAAGIAAENNVLVKDCQNVGNVSIVANGPSNPPAVDAPNSPIFMMGGIVGLNHSAIIQNCYNQGSMEHDIQLDECTLVSAGGIAGHTQGASALIQNCYNVGDMKIDVHVTNSEFYLSVGGIAGYNVGFTPIDIGTTLSTIENCYNSGNIVTSSNSFNPAVGSIVGGSDGIDENNYYLENTVTDGHETGIAFNSSGVLSNGESLLNVLNEWVNNNESSSDYNYWMIGSVNGMSLPVFTDWLREAEDMGVMMIPNDDGIYEITHPYQLALIANDLNGQYVLLNDIDLSEYSWTPIGNYDAPFTGTFDGNGHTIYNLKVSGDMQYAGLFGYIGYIGVVKNLMVVNCVIDADSSSPTWAGIIAGQNNGTIENSFGIGIVNSIPTASDIDKSSKDNTAYYILAAVVVVIIVMALAGLLRKKD